MKSSARRSECLTTVYMGVTDETQWCFDDHQKCYCSLSSTSIGTCYTMLGSQTVCPYNSIRGKFFKVSLQLLPVCFQPTSSLVPVYIQPTFNQFPVHFQSDISLLLVCLQSTFSLIQVRFQITSRPLPLCI
jgi:hypothetical protein